MTSGFVCPICKGTEFSDIHGRKEAHCNGCGSVERTRIIKLLIDEVVRPKPDAKVLHIHPDPSLMPALQIMFGAGYDPVEIKSRKAVPGVRKIDPIKDLVEIAPETYDLVIHNHILQEIPGNYTVFLNRLQMILKPGGYHLFSIPLNSGHFMENLDASMTPEQRKENFGREKHLRRFGRADFEQTIGIVFGLTRQYSLLDHLLSEVLLGAGVMESQWKLSSNSVFVVRR